MSHYYIKFEGFSTHDCIVQD